ncbi:MAG: UDP-3-O-(3-hydroxymyristoyl)glucosamine N-acyltransferase [Ectothiorhodospiraceae bacterium]
MTQREAEGASLESLARVTGAKLVGEGSLRIRQVAPLESAEPGCIAFLANSRYRRYLNSTAASAVIVREEDAAGAEVALLVTPNPYLAFALVAQYLNPEPNPEPGVHPSALVHPSAHLAEDVSVGPHASIGADVEVAAGCSIGAGVRLAERVRIGPGSRLLANVSVYANTVIGARVIVHSGAVLGADGFGFANDEGRWVKLPQLGGVRIGDDVEIGANTTVDRGAMGDTVIEEGVKIDNQVQIAHNVRIGAHTAIASMVGISGSTKVGKYCTIGGAAGLAGHLSIADGTMITGMAMITHDIREAGAYSTGTQMAPTHQWRKNAVRFNQLDKMAKRIKLLEQRLAEREGVLRKDRDGHDSE